MTRESASIDERNQYLDVLDVLALTSVKYAALLRGIPTDNKFLNPRDLTTGF